MSLAALSHTFCRRIVRLMVDLPCVLRTSALFKIASIQKIGKIACLHGLLLSCVISLNVGAANFDYDVKIDAPDPIKSLLEKNLDIVRWRGNANMDAAQLERLYRVTPEQIRMLIATEGYYSPQVTSSIDKQEKSLESQLPENKSLVSFRVMPGSATLVGKVDIDLQGFGNDAEALTRTQSLRDSWNLQPGQLFRQADWEVAKAKLLRQATLTHTPKAQLTESSAVVDPVKAEAVLKVVLDSGPEIAFGPLEITGLQRHPVSIVTNLNSIRPNDPYSEIALLELQSRLQDTGYFSGVEVSMNLDQEFDTNPDRTINIKERIVPITVKLTENKMKKIVAGVGYSTNTGSRAQINYDDLSVLGLKLKSGITLETKKQTARGELFWPVTPKGYNDSIAAQFARTDITGETTAVTSLTGKRSWGNAVTERSLTLEYLTERKSVDGLEKSRSQSVPLTYGLTLRRTNSVMFPTEGYILNAQAGGAPLPLLTDRVFLRASVRIVGYRHLAKSDLLILRGELGGVLAKDKDGIPEAYLFRAGGDQSVRGYAYQQFGVASGKAIVGGRYLATGSIEAQHWLVPNWGAAVFYDIGDAADSPAALNLKSGYGVGARWRSPVGPVNLDVAYGRATKQYRLHFSLGFTF